MAKTDLEGVLRCPNELCNEILVRLDHVLDCSQADCLYLSKVILPPLPDTFLEQGGSSGSLSTEKPLPLRKSPGMGWKMVLDAMQFENMGFTKVIPPSLKATCSLPQAERIPEPGPSTAPEQVLLQGQRFLCCAVCDIGPLGISVPYSDDEGTGCLLYTSPSPRD